MWMCILVKLLGSLPFLPKGSVFLTKCWIYAFQNPKLKAKEYLSFIVFLELLPALHTTLQAMVFPRQYQDLGNKWSWDGDSVTKANGFIFQLESSSFVICFKILLEILQNPRSLTIKLQKQAIDVIYAYKQVQSVLSSDERGFNRRNFKNLRRNSQTGTGATW